MTTELRQGIVRWSSSAEKREIRLSRDGKVEKEIRAGAGEVLTGEFRWRDVSAVALV
jgi:hypothetical protein